MEFSNGKGRECEFEAAFPVNSGKLEVNYFKRIGSIQDSIQLGKKNGLPFPTVYNV